jgi:hypothetical protein
MIDLETRPTRADRIVAEPVEDMLVLLSLENEQYYTLEHVGCRLWELCDGTRSVAEMVGQIYGEFDADRQVVEEDVLELLTDLARERLVRV